MKVLEKRHTANASKAGLQAAKLLSVHGHALRLSASADWLHYLDNRRRQALVQLAGLDDATLRMEGAKTGTDSIEIGGGAEISLTRRTTLRLNILHEAQTEQSVTNGNVSVNIEF